MNDNDQPMKPHPNRRPRFLITPPEEGANRTECTVRPIYVPRHPLREACLYLALCVASVLGITCWQILKASPFDRLADPYRTVAAQVDWAVESDPRTLEAYRKIGLLFRRSVDKAGIPHWKVSGYVPIESIK